MEEATESNTPLTPQYFYTTSGTFVQTASGDYQMLYCTPLD